jgi:methionine synthase II (cobalamin-independent)
MAHITLRELAGGKLLPTVVVGSHAFPSWLWSARKDIEAGNYGPLDLSETLDDDVAGILREEIAELARLGATYVQLDAPQYTFLADPRMRDRLGPPGVAPEAVLDQMIAIDNATIAGFPGINFGVHLCRGNYRGHWLSTGGYDPIARRLFQDLKAHRLLLEFDSPQLGVFCRGHN